MNKTRTWAAWAVLLACLPPAFAGCQNFPKSRPEADREPTRREVESAKDESPKPRGTGRAPIQSTGLDDRSREIERSLGAR